MADGSNSNSRVSVHQTLSILVPMMMTALGVAWWLSAEIEGIRTDSITRFDQVMQRIATDEQRITQLEKTSDQRYSEDSAFRQSIQTQIGTLISQFADLRVSIARSTEQGSIQHSH
jgi:lipopolysaccharide export LptBFGC system permease protein LptF